MRLFYSAASLVLACGLAAPLFAAPAHRRDAASHYRVRRGDTLSGIASHFGVTVGQLRDWNHLRGSEIRTGHTLRVAERPAATTPSSPQNAETYRVRRGDTLSEIASHFGVTVDQLRDWNHLHGSEIHTGHALRVGEHRAATQSSPQNTETATLYRVRRGDTLSEIASHFGVTVDQLQNWNHLRGSEIHTGHTLRVGEHPAATQSSPQNTETATLYRVRRGDTLSGIASHFSVTVDQLRDWNHLDGYEIHTGHTLRVASDHEAAPPAKAPSPERTAAASLYRVHRGDTLSGIARHFGVTVAQLRRWNNLRGSVIQTGDRLSVGSDHNATEVAASQPSTPPHARAEAEYKNVAEIIPPIPMRNGHLYVPPPLRGSHASLLRQNRRGKAEGLKRIQNVAQIRALHSDGKLVSLPVSKALTVDDGLPARRRYTRRWTAKFLVNLAHAHWVRFHSPLQVTSAVRTVKFQRRLIRVNANAAPASGAIASPHLMGATIDITKKGLSRSEIAWMRAYLLLLEQEGKIDVEEEFYQSCFHITVYKSYVPKRKRHHHHTSTTLLATGVR